MAENPTVYIKTENDQVPWPEIRNFTLVNYQFSRGPGKIEVLTKSIKEASNFPPPPEKIPLYAAVRYGFDFSW